MIYKVGEEDYDKLLDVWVSAVEATHHFLSKEDYEFYKTHVPIYFNHLDLYAYKNDEGNILGYIGISDDDMIDMLFVHNSMRAKGVGKVLLDYAVNTLDVCRVDVNEQNKQALDFYFHLGFEEIGRSEYDGEGKAYPILHLEKKKI